jgi:hypothetical protein
MGMLGINVWDLRVGRLWLAFAEGSGEIFG